MTWAELRQDVLTAVAALARCEVVITVVGGDVLHVHDGGVSDLRRLGTPAPPHVCEGFPDLVARIGLPVAPTDLLPTDAAVLVRLLHDSIRHVVICVRREDAVRVAEAVREAVGESNLTVGLLIQGDLASSPLRRGDSDRGTEAIAWDRAALPLLQAGDRSAWSALKPGDVEPRALGPIDVAMALLGDAWDGRQLQWSAPRGVGAVVGLVSGSPP